MTSITRFALLFVLALFTLHAHGAPSTKNGYGTIETKIEGSVLRATINNPPINLYDYKLSADLFALVKSLENQTKIKVVILASANPDFWIAHYDLHFVSVDHPPTPPSNGTLAGITLLETRTMLATIGVIFIAEIDGRVTGAGDEIAVQSDMRFAGPGARLSQFEVGFGGPPGAGGVQFLVKLIGRARAFEYILSGNSVDGPEAERIGWVNRAYGSKIQLTSEVNKLAQRIAAFPQSGLAAIKTRINFDKPSAQSLQGDNDAFFGLFAAKSVQKSVDKYLTLSDDQSANKFELGLPDGLTELVQ